MRNADNGDVCRSIGNMGACRKAGKRGFRRHNRSPFIHHRNDDIATLPGTYFALGQMDDLDIWMFGQPLVNLTFQRCKILVKPAKKFYFVGSAFHKLIFHSL
jgi:hypothetical protein